MLVRWQEVELTKQISFLQALPPRLKGSRRRIIKYLTLRGSVDNNDIAVILSSL